MDAHGAKSLGICAAAARPEVDTGRARRETFVDGRLLEYLDSPALALSAVWRPLKRAGRDSYGPDQPIRLAACSFPIDSRPGALEALGLGAAI